MCHVRQECPLGHIAEYRVHLFAVVELVYVVKLEHVLLRIVVVVVVPLRRHTAHEADFVCVGDGIVEEEVVVPQVSERLVGALVASALLNGGGLPRIARRKVVVEPELGVVAEGATELEPLGKLDFTCYVGEEVVAVGLVAVHLGRTYRVAYAAVPFGVAFRSAPRAVGVLDGLHGQRLHGVADAVRALFLLVGAERKVVGKLKPLGNLSI